MKLNKKLNYHETEQETELSWNWIRNKKMSLETEQEKLYYDVLALKKDD
jgi:hypothetical protein